MEKTTHYPLIILGSGPAGLTAALYATRLGVTTLVLEGALPGGQLIQTTYVENWPGEEKILGPLLMRKLHDHAAKFGTQYSSHIALSVELGCKPFAINTKQQSLTCDALIIATGASPNRLNCPGEQEYWGKGVSTCAVCDGALYRDRPIVVTGGGDSAAEKASFMAQLTKHVTLIHHQAALTATPVMQERVLHNPHITVIYNSAITAITGDGTSMTGITITNQQTKQTHTLQAHALFLAIGSHPNTDLFNDQLALAPSGHIIVQYPSTRTSVAGVFACGDVSDPYYRQAITAAGSGCAAALDAINFLQHAG